MLNPSLTVSPSIVPWLGVYDFTVTGADFTPNSQLFLVVCTAPGDPLSPDTPAAELAAALARITQSDCDLANANPVAVDTDGSFTAQVEGTVGAVNFVWVASDAAQTEAAAAPVFAEKLETEPVTPQPGVWVPPEAGMVPAVYPICVAPPYGEDCIPPSEWQRGEVTPNRRPNELPRRTEMIAQFANWCETVTFPGTCHRLLTLMKWPVDYMGADPICVLNEYTRRAQAYSAGAPENVAHLHGWHNCATVIDPLIGTPADGLGENDIGYRLSDTGLTVAEQCRAVLPSDIGLEDRGLSFGAPPTQRFGNDCDAWGAYVERRIAFRWDSLGDCTRAYYFAQEWMEHYHGVPENYYPITC